MTAPRSMEGPTARRVELRQDGLISIVVPLYNEQENVDHLMKRLMEVLQPSSLDHEIVLVDDGSHDDTWAAIARWSESGVPVTGCRLSKNFGHQAAILAGMGVARGSAVITMDGDLQHPPEVIWELVDKWRSGFDIVNTRRLDPAATSAFKRLTSRYFYRLFSVLAEVDLSEGSSDFRLIDRRALDEVLRLRDSNPFIRGTVEWIGFRKITVPFNAAQRHSGRSKFNFRRMLAFAASGVVSHSTVPLRIGVWVGVLTSVFACLEMIYVLIIAYRGQSVPGWASILGFQSLFFGIIFILLGIIGTYLSGIYRMLQSRPNYIIAEIVTMGRQGGMRAHD